MAEAYDRAKFLEDARELEAQRLSRLNEWNQKNEAWIKENGPIPFQVPKLIFGGK